jgi:hypothetical protein
VLQGKKFFRVIINPLFFDLDQTTLFDALKTGHLNSLPITS